MLRMMLRALVGARFADNCAQLAYLHGMFARPGHQLRSKAADGSAFNV
jgi:hypothetical protein